MATYRNDTSGARAIHLTGGGHLLVEPGTVAEISELRVKRLAPGLVKTDGDLPRAPDELAETIAPARSKSASASPSSAKSAPRKRTATRRKKATP